MTVDRECRSVDRRTVMCGGGSPTLMPVLQLVDI